MRSIRRLMTNASGSTRCDKKNDQPMHASGRASEARDGSVPLPHFSVKQHLRQRYCVIFLTFYCPKTKVPNQAVTCLTEAALPATYSSSNRAETCDRKRMPNKYKKIESAIGPIKNESTRQRWEMFHRAIAHAKQSNNAADLESENGSAHPENSGPLLTIVR